MKRRFVSLLLCLSLIAPSTPVSAGEHSMPSSTIGLCQIQAIPAPTLSALKSIATPTGLRARITFSELLENHLDNTWSGWMSLFEWQWARRSLEYASQNSWIGRWLPYYISFKDPLRDVLEWMVVQTMYRTYPLRTGRAAHADVLKAKAPIQNVVLMTYPNEFLVPWSINDWMDPKKERVNRIKAARDWEHFVDELRKAGVEVHLIPVQKNLTDMQFTANGGVIGIDQHGDLVFIPPHFSKTVRQGETAVFTEYMRKKGYKILDVAGPGWEGEGDTLLHIDRRYGMTRFGGYGDPNHGLRSNLAAQQRVAEALGQHFVGLELVNPRYYHLDTAFCPLQNGTSALYYPGAFSPEAQKLIKQWVSDPIELTEEEAADFSANAVPVGDKVFMNKVSPRLQAELKKRGLTGISIPLPEFKKSGGNAKCNVLFLGGPLYRSLGAVSTFEHKIQTSDFYRTTVTHRLIAAEAQGDARETVAQLVQPRHDIVFRFGFPLDNGQWSTHIGSRIHEGKLPEDRVVESAIGKGGIRDQDSLPHADVDSLHLDMDTKIPEGVTVEGRQLRGGKGGMNVNLNRRSRAEKIRAMRAYTRGALDATWALEHRVAFGPLFDVPAPDIGTSQPDVNLMDQFADEVLRWMVDHHETILPWLQHADRALAHDLSVLVANVAPEDADQELGYADRVIRLRGTGMLSSLRLLASVTGKSLKYGGIAGRSTATGQGMAYTVLETAKALKWIEPDAERMPSGWSVAIDGFGNVGQGAALALTQIGLSVKAILEFDPTTTKPFALYHPDGFTLDDFTRMKTYKAAHGTLLGYAGAHISTLPEKEFWQLPVQFYAPSSIQGKVTGPVAEHLHSSVIGIIEGANGATTLEGDDVLQRRKITVMPDVMANSGGVLVSWMEIIQNVFPMGEAWLEAYVNDLLHRMVTERIETVMSFVERRRKQTGNTVTWRQAMNEMLHERLVEQQRRALSVAA